MKFSITRKRNKVKKISGKIGSILLAVSAFAAFTPGMNAEEKKVESNSKKEEVKSETFTARKVFENLSSTYLEAIPKSTRLDMLDYWDADSIYKAVNVLEGLSWIESLSDNYMRLRISPVSTLQIKILPVKKGEIALTIYTVGDEAQSEDSFLKFFDQDLKELPTEKYFKSPEIKDFFEIPKGSYTKMKEIEQMIPFPTIAYDASPENNDLKARLTVERYMNQDDWNIAKLFALPYVILEWKGDKYKPEKKK